MIATKTWDSLTKDELYELLSLRTEVFVVEQNCPYQELDGKDQWSIHFLSFHEDRLLAYLRLIKPKKRGEDVWIGRVVVKKEARGQRLGVELMKKALLHSQNSYPESTVKISAQSHLQKYYNQMGFQPRGEGYLEDGIPHIEMWLSTADS